MTNVFHISLNYSLWDLAEGSALVPVLDVLEGVCDFTIFRRRIEELKLTDVANSFFSRPFQAKLARLTTNQMKRHIPKLNNKA